MTPPRSASRLLLLALAAALAPSPARALHLLEEPLSLRDSMPAGAVLLAAARPAPAPARPGLAAARPGSLDFDLLGKPPPVRLEDETRMRRRRSMLNWHQGIGMGLVALQLGTTVVGQLDYSDKYASDPAQTGRYELSHSVLAYTTLGVFAVNGAIALLAPRPKASPRRGFDRVWVHRLGMLAATAGMLSQGALGVYTDQREGRLDQAKYARTHLVLGYATAAAVGVAVGALVF